MSDKPKSRTEEDSFAEERLFGMHHHKTTISDGEHTHYGRGNTPREAEREASKRWRECESDSDSSGSFCFISTACVEAKELPDDCLELQVLRTFRDTYVRELPNGNDLIQNYYALAPSIVRRINTRPDRIHVYSSLYGDLVQRCVDLILDHKPEEALQTYMKTVRSLELHYGK